MIGNVTHMALRGSLAHTIILHGHYQVESLLLVFQLRGESRTPKTWVCYTLTTVGASHFTSWYSLERKGWHKVNWSYSRNSWVILICPKHSFLWWNFAGLSRISSNHHLSLSLTSWWLKRSVLLNWWECVCRLTLNVNLLLRFNQLLKLSQLCLIQLLCLNWDWLIVYKLKVLAIWLEYHVWTTPSNSKLLMYLLLYASLVILSSFAILWIAVCRA
jgi:hypothetical protein